MKFLPLLFIFFVTPVLAQEGLEGIEKSLGFKESHFGVSVSGGGGITDFTILSPNTKAIYSGIGLEANIHAPIWQNEFVSFNAGVGYRHIDALNNANTTAGREFVSLGGPGLAFNMNFYRILIGANYYFFKGNHYWVGDIGDELNYKMNVLNTSIGLHVSVSDSMQVLFSYGMSKGSVPKSKTNFNADAPFESNTIWVHLVYGNGETLGSFFKKLFK